MTSTERPICCWSSPYRGSSNNCKLAENRLATDNRGVMCKVVVFGRCEARVLEWKAGNRLSVMSRSRDINDGQFLDSSAGDHRKDPGLEASLKILRRVNVAGVLY